MLIWFVSQVSAVFMGISLIERSGSYPSYFFLAEENVAGNVELLIFVTGSMFLYTAQFENDTNIKALF